MQPQPPQILHKPLFSNALGNMQCPQEHLKTIVYAKFGGQTKCIMGNSKIENRPFPSSSLPPLQSESKCKVFVMRISFHSYVK